MVALKLLQLMPVEERKLLFSTLISLTFSYHSDTPLTLKAIYALPHDWIIDHPEDEVKRIYTEVNQVTALKLAGQAAESSDEEIRDAGRNS